VYPVSELYKSKIEQDGRVFETKIIIDHELGSLELNNDDLSLGGLTYNSSTQSGDDFTIGGVVANDISLSIRRVDDTLDNVNFEGAIIRPSVGLEVSEGVFEYVPLGVFIVDEDKREMDVINLKAIDNMIRLGDKYSESTLAYPATLFQIYQNICSHNNLTPATTTFQIKIM